MANRGQMKEGIIYINDSVYSTLLAISNQEQQKGLMGKSWPPPIMSFIYEYPSYNKFWMANTPSPLDIVFAHKGKITQICYGEPFSTSVIGNDEFSDLVVEFPFGTVAKSNIKIGHPIDIVAPCPTQLKKLISEAKSGIYKI